MTREAHAHDGAAVTAVPTPPARIEVRGLGKRFESATSGSREALRDIDLAVRQGEFVCVLGPSGCGKSTLLSVLGGFERPTTGDVYLDGARLNGPSREIVTVFQEHALFPWRSVLQNVEYGLQARGVPAPERRERAMRELQRVGLAGCAAQRPSELSGGMKQRASIARAMAVAPEVILMDEPFGALDSVTRARMQEELARIWRGGEMTVVFVTHDVDEAVFLADRVVVMTPTPGRIQEIVPITLPRPRERDSEAFFAIRVHILRALHLAEDRVPPEYEI